VAIAALLDDRALALEVKDEGLGIASTHWQAIFERFRQLNTGSTHQYKGQGLGLSVVKALVELLNGNLTLSSQPDQGSTFRCLLPPLNTEDPTTSSFDGNLYLFSDASE